MYQSALDPLGKLAFPFDPLRALHAREDSELQWPEFPYKQVLVDRVRSKVSAAAGGGGSSAQKLSVEAAAGALLMALGQETGALFEVEQHRPRDHGGDSEQGDATSVSGDWHQLESRFTAERAAFQAAKRAYLQQQKQKVQSQLASIDARKRAEEEQEAHEAWRQRQIVKRYKDGSKYDGDGVRESNVFIPRGHGTLWVPQKKQFMAVGDIKRVPRYIGEWMDGFMHGQGTYFWDSGDSWTGYFLRDEMEGKGVYTFKDSSQHHEGSNEDDSEQRTGRAESSQRVRYYSASRHVCWGHELVRGCRLMLFGNRHYGSALATVIKRHDVDLEQETEVVLMSYNEKNDTHLVRKCGTEDTRWLSLHNTNFCVLSGKPIARLESD